MKRIKYLQINVAQRVKELYIEYCKTLLQKIYWKELSEWSDIHIHGLEYLRCQWFLSCSTDWKQHFLKFQLPFLQKLTSWSIYIYIYI